MKATFVSRTALALSAFLFAAGPARADKPKAVHAPTAVGTSAASTPKTTATANEKGVQGQPKAASSAAGTANVLSTEEGKEGVKTYKFGAVEVEGRLRSPQLIYFLRRVRAEFAAGDLGHRSFLRELADTEREPAFR
jgi:hypothetical protein